YTCRHFSRAYLHHLFLADEMLGPTLLSLHNVVFYLRLMAGIREAIERGRFAAFRTAWLGRWNQGRGSGEQVAGEGEVEQKGDHVGPGEGDGAGGDAGFQMQ